MEKKNVNCPFCGYEKQIGADCPKCGRGGVILKVEDVAAGCRYHKPLSEHDSFDSAYEAACKLFDDGTWDDFLIDDGGHLTSLPGYRLVKETCDFCVSIPMKGGVNSLNASNAAAILMYEVLRSRSDGARLTGRESVQLEKPRGE